MSPTSRQDREAALRRLRRVRERLRRDGEVVSRADGTTPSAATARRQPRRGRGAARLGRARRGDPDDRDRPRLRHLGAVRVRGPGERRPGRRFDLAFVDGNHRFDGVFLDLVYLGRLLRRGAVVFLDDYQLPAVARAASFCLRNLAWTLEEVSPTDALHQWAVLRTSRTADERPFDFHVEF